MKKKAFTLIELLIVVAIIAILAAIAVPNFLEAQVRSKVSRARADMRSYATALEAYVTDHNNYPTYHYVEYDSAGEKAPSSSGGKTVKEFFVGGETDANATVINFEGDYQVTTPIAYISSIPPDPFHDYDGDDPFETRHFMYVNWKYYYNLGGIPDSTWDTISRMYGDWRMTSAGPDKTRGDSYHISYDPSNGTVSTGQIHRTARNPEGHAIDPW